MRTLGNHSERRASQGGRLRPENASIRHRVLMRLLIVLVIFGPSTRASAETRGSAADRAACTPDVFRLCADDISDEQAILSCLRHNVVSLSPECHRVIAPAPRGPETVRR